MASVISGRLAIIGAGPAGLMAAEVAASEGVAVDLYDAMPSVGRKFLLAGKGGLNLTHAEAFERFLERYGHRREALEPSLQEFGPEAIRAWAASLGVETFVGSSRRVFPREMKSAPLLRAWIRRLRQLPVTFHVRHRWQGWSQAGFLQFAIPEGRVLKKADAVILALGGGSWPRLGSDGAWVSCLEQRGVVVQPLKPSNSGFEVAWTPHFSEKHAGQPVKPVIAQLTGVDGLPLERRGEFVITRTGIEGSLIYALSSPLRTLLETQGHAELTLDLAPDRLADRIEQDLARLDGSRSTNDRLYHAAGLKGVKSNLLREIATASDFAEPARLTRLIKSLPIQILATRPLEEAISSAGGVDFASLEESLMISAYPGLFCAGEMLDWEAPTGGYLLTASLATGRMAGLSAIRWLTNLER